MVQALPAPRRLGTICALMRWSGAKTRWYRARFTPGLGTQAARRVPIQSINQAYERMPKSDSKYRFSIDMASLAA